MPNLYVTNSGGTTDITQLAETITWSGNYQQRARTLEFGMISSAEDKSIPTIKCDLGNAVTLTENGETLFSGYVFTRQKSTEGNTIDYTCYDNGFYLKSKASYSFSGVTPEAITKRLCADFGITVGSIATTGIKITRNFFGCALYDTIQTAYTLASAQNGKKYHIVFRGAALCVAEKAITDTTLVIEGGSNLMDATITESVENMVNQVKIYNSKDQLVRTMKNDSLIKLYGLMQDYLKQADGEDASAKAQKLLDDNQEEQKITIDNLGNIANVTGGTVVVREPYTGLYGLFYIDEDTHTWKNGLYLNKLVVDFKNIMDEKDVGSLPNKTGSKTAADDALSKIRISLE